MPKSESVPVAKPVEPVDVQIAVDAAKTTPKKNKASVNSENKKLTKKQREAEIAERLKQELKPVLEKELKPELEKQLTLKIEQQLKAKLETEIKNQLEIEITSRLEAEVKAKLEKELTEKLLKESKQPVQPDPGQAVEAEVEQQPDEIKTTVDVNMDTKRIVEAILFAAEKPMTAKHIQKIYPELERPATEDIQAAIQSIAEDYSERPVALKKLASGYRFQVKEGYAYWVSRLFEDKPPRYSRALLETMAIIAYRQPVTRGDIEDIRGVSVSTNIIRTLLDREWIRIIAHKEVPGRPALYGTTKQFLDYFNLNSLQHLPTLEEIKEMDFVSEKPKMAGIVDDTIKEHDKQENPSEQQSPETEPKTEQEIEAQQIIELLSEIRE